MALRNITIQHTSPLITFNGGWVQHDSNGADFSVTQNLGASATFTFPGKWVQIQGTKNEYHGAFSVSIDGQTYNRSGATSREEQELVATIFNTSLGDVQHTMVIRNDEWAALNIESITWTCAIGTNSSATQLDTFSVAASDPSFTFLPKGAWTANDTLQSTSATHASVNYTFSGDAVSIFGSSGPDNSAYSVWRDGEAPQYFNATRSLSTPDVRLYFASGFGSGEHTIMLKSESAGLFQIQRAEVITASGGPSPGPQGVSPGTTTSTSPARSSTPIMKPEPGVARSNTRLSAGAVAAISCAAVLVVFLLLAVWLLLRRNKALWMRLQRGYMVQSQFDQFESSSPPTGVTPLILPAQSRPPSPPRRKLQLASDDEETFQAPALVRPGTTLSQMTASTLVAEAGSDMIQVGANGLKPLHLASRFRSGTTTTTAFTRNTIDSAGQRSPALASTIASPRHSRPARSDTGNSNGDYYDPYITAARMPQRPPRHDSGLTLGGLPEINDAEEVDELLRRPIRQHEPSESPTSWYGAYP